MKEESNSKKNQKIEFLEERLLSEKENGAILPMRIFPADKEIKMTFNKEQLIEILLEEDKVRLSDETMAEYDANIEDPNFNLLEFDEGLIKKALRNKGYKPDEDGSFDAYLLATGEFINDEDVRKSVVWMRYDKCRVGDLKAGMKFPYEKEVKVHDFEGKEFLLAELLDSNRPNLLVSGSLS